MTKQRHEIGDDEIRIITPSGNTPHPDSHAGKRRWLFWLIGSVLVLSVILLIYIIFMKGEEEKPNVEEATELEVITDKAPGRDARMEEAEKEKPFVTVKDTIINHTPLRILTPENATPSLVVGQEALSDSLAVLALQAADIRGDNGEIAGAFVLKGELLSRGASKSGFCAIINGEPTIGVADATSLLEKAIESEGYFFRQYPLVVGGQIVENKPKGKALRKALSEKDGKISVILSKEKLTFHEFSQALAEAGVTNAIYLVGSSAPGIYTDIEGNRFNFGREMDSHYEKINYIVWH